MSAIQHVIPDPPPNRAPLPAARARGVWTTERVELLRSYASAGYTCLQISREIGVTRNAVIGKLNRLGLTTGPRVKRAREGGSERTQHPRPMTQRRILRAVHAATPSVDGATAVPVVVASSAPCALLELTHAKCHWPIGGADARDFSFCGNAVVAGLSYCAGHARMAYRAPARRRA